MERYLAFHIERGLGTELSVERYRGLMPQTALILKQSDGRFYQNTKRRVDHAGDRVDCTAADSLHGHVTQLYKATGIRLGSSHSGRRSFASNLLHKGASLESVQQLLGHSKVDHVMPYFEVSQATLKAMFTDVL